MDYFSSLAFLTDPMYWLTLRPVPLPPDAVSSILFFFAFFVIAAVVLKVAARSIRKAQPRWAQLCRRVAGPLQVTGILGLLVLFFTYEQVPLLGMRLWFLVLALYFLFLVGRLAHYVVVDFPHLRHDDAERARIQKYLPKKK